MKLKYIMIVSLVFNIALLGLVLMQKSSAVSQAEEAYQNSTDKFYKSSEAVINGQNAAIENNAILWEIACTAIHSAKTSADFARIEKSLTNTAFSTKVAGTQDGTGSLRTISWSDHYYIVASFDKKKNFTGVDVSALLGDAPSLTPEEDDSEEGEEE